jgi:preprotein translocase subunit YajC
VRKLVSFLFLIVLAAGVWFGARWLVHRGEIKVTIVFKDPHGLKRGDSVVENGSAIGRVVSVNPIDDKTAVTVRLDRNHRRAIVSDSMFAVDHHELVVTNTFAIGRPVDDGTILDAREDRVTQWLAKHGGAVKPYLDAARAKADQWIDRDFSEWSAKLPEWKKEGSASFERHLDDVKARVSKAEADLRDNNHSDEARKLKEKFDRWLEEAKK